MRALLALLALAAACADDIIVEVGIVDYYGESDGVLQGPATARAGEPIHFRVMTYGGGCDDSVHLVVETEGDHVDLTPYDSRPVDAICTTQLVRLAHDGELTLDTPGTWTIRVHGRRVDGRGDALIEETYPLTVD